MLLFDIETAPILGYVWGLWENNLGLSQIKSDWHLLAWSAKWLDEPASKIKYMDQRRAKSVENDKQILQGIWKLLDEADIVITQNGKAFDEKKLNARFILNGMRPPSSYRHIDTKQLARKKFAFTSNKLEYLSDKLCTKYKKQKHARFSNFELWSECLKGNPKAWKEMERYNKYDVLSLEEVYKKMQPWDNSIAFNTYDVSSPNRCNCGCTKFRKNGYAFTSTGKFQRFLCIGCNRESRSKENLIPIERRKDLHK